MPRKSDERGFGFRKGGLLRILVAADAEQVLLAVEELGFKLPDRAPIESLSELVQELHQTSEIAIGNFFTEMAETIENAIFELEEDPAPGEAEAARMLRQFSARRKAFLLDLKRKRDQVEKEIFKTGNLLFPKTPTGTI